MEIWTREKNYIGVFLVISNSTKYVGGECYVLNIFTVKM